jgi:hypothetical protein
MFLREREAAAEFRLGHSSTSSPTPIPATTPVTPTPTPSSASCSTGRVEIGGNCCWPGQLWENGGCRGTPACPTGFERRPDLFPGDDDCLEIVTLVRATNWNVHCADRSDRPVAYGADRRNPGGVCTLGKVGSHERLVECLWQIASPAAAARGCVRAVRSEQAWCCAQ